MRKQIVVTGGLGFIGQHLVIELIKKDYYPIIIDDLSTGKLKTLKYFPRSRFSFLKCDIIDHGKLMMGLTQFKPTIIIHLAAIHFIPYCNENPLKIIHINVNGTQSLLEIARKRSIRNFFFASTAAIYKAKKCAHKENDIKQADDIYGISKKLGEELVEWYARKGMVNFFIFRLFNVYGPNDTTPHFIPSVISRIENSNDIIAGNLNTYRDYIFIDDVIDAIMLLLESKKDFNNSIYNIGTGKEYSGNAIIKIISQIYKKKITAEKVPGLTRKEDRKNLLANIEKFSNEYSWHPKYNIKQGLKKIIKTRSIKSQKNG